jgi:hypothetical protein
MLMNEKTKAAAKLIEDENNALEKTRDLYKDSGVAIDDSLTPLEKLNQALKDIGGKYQKLDSKTRQFVGGQVGTKTVFADQRNGILDAIQPLQDSTKAYEEATKSLDDYLKLLEEIGSTAGQQQDPPTPSGSSNMNSPDPNQEPAVKKPWWEKLFGDGLTEKLKQGSSKIKGFFQKLESDGQTGAENLKQVIENTFGTLGAIFDTQLAIQEQKDQERFDREKERLENSAAFETMTEEEKQAAMQKLEEDSFKKSKKIKRKQAQLEKAQAIFGAIVNTLAAITKALPNIPLANIVGALGFAQVAAITAQPIPKFADGGIVSGPTMGLMGEYQGARTNPEVIAPLDKLKSMMGSVDVNVNVTGHLDAEGIQIATVRGNDIARQKGGRSFN